MGETRNQRRSRRRRETREEREIAQKTKLIAQIQGLLDQAKYTLVFLMWRCGSMVGYVYNHPYYASGTRVTTSTVMENRFESTTNLWVAGTRNSIFKVVRMSEEWSNVGAGNPRKRLIYKLWPKMIFLGMLQRVMYNPGNSGYMQTMSHFHTVCDQIQL